MRVGFLPEMKFPRALNSNWKHFVRHEPYVWHALTAGSGKDDPQLQVNRKLNDLKHAGHCFRLPAGWEQSNQTMKAAIGRQ